ncbi:MAG TPA: chemotaxis protein CheW, partial [Polyangiales bacterium]|nr:chemotaxis protein CheW [Polyangiales bacterium]
MTQTLDRDEFIAGYLIEADEHVQSAVRNLLAAEAALRSDGPQHRLVRELFRSLHTLKGLSAMVGVDPIVDLAHEMEAILRDADRGSGKLAADAIELLLKGVRAIEQRLAAFAKRKPVPAAPRKLLEALADLQASAKAVPTPAQGALSLDPELASKLTPVEHEHLSKSVAQGRRARRIDFIPSPERSAQGYSITSVREKVGAIAEIVKVIPRSLPKSETAPGGLSFALIVLTEGNDDQLAAAACTQPSELVPIVLHASPQRGGSDEELGLDEGESDDAQVGKSFIRVEVARLDDALEKLAVLVVTRFKLTNAVTALRERGVDVREIAAILGENHRQLRDLRGAITRARMVSVAELLERVPLIVRGISRATGKQVQLVVNAGKAELDKAVAERIFPAIVHLVRNAVDHATESPAERERAGKPAEGTITVECFEHSNSQLEISVSDDGRGIDALEVGRRAGRSTPRDDRELLDLITLPGLSTRQDATSTSGRGMGMEIVRRVAVEVLGGVLSMRTKAGHGTTFTMRLPMSISILDSFSFVCAAQSFAVPVSVIDEIVSLEAASIVRPPAPARGREAGSATRLLERRGEAIPLFHLASLLQLGATDDDHGKAFIIRPNGQPFAFAIDRVLGQQEIVVRPVEDPLVKVPGIAGTTDLGDGQPTLVLDLVGLSTLVAASAAAV